MTDLFNNRYRIKSARLPNWDYHSDAAYFITICTAGKQPYFGEIGMVVETPGMASLPYPTPHPCPSPQPCKLSQPCRMSQPRMQLSPLGEIVESEWLKTPDLRPDMNLSLGNFVVMPDHFHAIIIIGPNDHNREYNKPVNGPQRKNLGSIIRGFKSAVTIYARKNNIDFGWQERFYDIIIPDDRAFIRISKYIENNPRNWHK